MLLYPVKGGFSIRTIFVGISSHWRNRRLFPLQRVNRVSSKELRVQLW